ncbi:MAG: hypothetical protein HOW73_15590 [Polyangiaceae bacterium]|nr:hypothetical protein [Polyangiaceae bacterium]
MTAGTWIWKLPDGIEAKFVIDEASVESVWIGRRLVSRSPPGGKREGHVSRLPPPPTGGEGAAVEVFFDPIRRAPVLTLDGREIAPFTPVHAPSSVGIGSVVEQEYPRKIGTTWERIGVPLGCFLIAGVLGLFIRSVLSDATAGAASIRYPTKAVYFCPAAVTMGLCHLVAPRRALESMARYRSTREIDGIGVLFTIVVAIFALAAAFAGNYYFEQYLLGRGYILS